MNSFQKERKFKLSLKVKYANFINYDYYDYYVIKIMILMKIYVMYIESFIENTDFKFIAVIEKIL